KGLFRRAVNFGKFVGNVILICLTLVLICAGLVGATISGTPMHNFWVASGVNVIVAIGAVWATLNMIFGISILDLSQTVRTKITTSRYATLCHKSGISAD